MNLSKQFRAFISDHRGHVIMWQTPNFLLWAWIILKLASLLLHNESFKNHVGLLSKAVLFAWAYLEITDGASPFRRILGAIIITFTIVSFFR
jgi:hypothetical protein